MNHPFVLIYAVESGICGVKSSLKKQPMRTHFKQSELESFKKAKSYEQWEFKYKC